MVLAIPTDVSDPEAVQALIAQTIDHYQRIDILINNAGVIWPIEAIIDTDLDEWVYNIHINLIGPFYTMHSVVPAMLAQGYGRIINISSGLGRVPVAGLSAYGAAKAGLDQLTRVIASEVVDTGITVNVLHPGIIDTEMQAELRNVDTSESTLDLGIFHQYFESQQLVAPYDVARLVYWLAGPWSKGRSGEIFSFRDEAWLGQVDRDLYQQ